MKGLNIDGAWRYFYVQAGYVVGALPDPGFTVNLGPEGVYELISFNARRTVGVVAATWQPVLQTIATADALFRIAGPGAAIGTAVPGVFIPHVEFSPPGAAMTFFALPNAALDTFEFRAFLRQRL